MKLMFFLIFFCIFRNFSLPLVTVFTAGVLHRFHAGDNGEWMWFSVCVIFWLPLFMLIL